MCSPRRPAYINEEKGVTTAEEALQGALDIFAEEVSDDAATRQKVRELTMRKGSIKSIATGKADEETDVYAIYADYEEPISESSAAPHPRDEPRRARRSVARSPGRADGRDSAAARTTGTCRGKPTVASEHLRAALEDAYKRLVDPSIERGSAWLTDGEGGRNRRSKSSPRTCGTCLLQPPVRGQNGHGGRPGVPRGRSKSRSIDKTGKVLDIAVTYPTPPHNKIDRSEKNPHQPDHKHNVQVIASATAPPPVKRSRAFHRGIDR